MDFLSLFDVSERWIDLVNPSSPGKVIGAGEDLGLRRGERVVEFGCGYAEVLLLWAERFGVEGVGIEFRERAAERARRRVAERGLSDRIEIVHADGAAHPVEPGRYDVAACIGASFIWGGFRPMLEALKRAVRPGGRLAVGEPYWRSTAVPPEVREMEKSIHLERDLLAIARAEGLTVSSIRRSDETEWDAYETANWRGLLAWLDENPGHPERGDVLERLRSSQDAYLGAFREHCGWAIYVLREAP